MVMDDTATFSLQDILRPENLADPYPFYRRLRGAAPVLWDEPGGTWVLTRYADVVAALRDPRFSAERVLASQRGATGSGPIEQAMSRQMLFLDPPDHTRLRGLVNKAFTPRMVEAMRPRIQDLVDELLDTARQAGRVDLIRDFAFPLPATVIAHMMGVPVEDRDQFREWSECFGLLLGGTPLTEQDLEQARIGVFSMMNYFMQIGAERRQDPRDDLISALIAAEDQGDTLSSEELLINCVLLLAAGHGTTTHLIGNGAVALLRHPRELARLRADPTLIAGAVDELLRYDSPVQVTGRTVTEDVEIGGTRIARGQHVVMVLGAANHDPAQFGEPERLDLGRGDNRHVSFSHGIHFCLGAALARLEGQIALGTLVRRFPNPRLDVAPESLQWMPSVVFRGVESLPVTLQAG